MPRTRKETGAAVDLWRGFTPFATQRRFLESTAKYRLLSSGYGGGKSAVGCRESIRHAMQFPGSVNLVARDTGTHLRDTTVRTFWREARRIGLREGVHHRFNKQEREIEWWNGSVTLFRHFEDVEALGSFELSTAFIDEGSEVHDDIYTALFPGRLRAHLPGCTIGPMIQDRMDRGLPFDDLRCPCPQRGWVCTNPGGSAYLKQVTLGNQEGWEWFPVGPAENPFNGPDYYRELAARLRKRGEVWYRRLYEGSWDAFEGQRFTGFDRETHVLPAPFRPGPQYGIVEGWDFGHRETFVVWIAYDPRQEEPAVVFAELQVREVERPEDVADRVKRIRREYGIADRVVALGDPAGAAASQFSAIGPIMAYAQLGLHIAPCRAGKSPVARADLLAHWFGARRRQHDGSWWPGLVIGPDCPALVDSVVNLRWDPRSSREQFVKENDHGADALGYGIIGVPPPVEAQQDPGPPPGVNPTPQQVLRQMERAGSDEGWVAA